MPCYWPGSSTEKSFKNISEITGSGLRTVRRIIKSWKNMEPSTILRRMCGRKSILNDRDRRSLK